MTGCVVDASVAMKWLVTEEHSDEAVRLLRKELTLVAPELVFAEVANALWAMRRRGHIDRADAAAAVDTLRDAPIVVPFSMSQLAAAAVGLSLDIDHPVYLALAYRSGYPVVTADKRFLGKARAHPSLSDRVLHVADVAPRMRARKENDA